LEEFILNKDEIFYCLKGPLEDFYDIELYDLVLGVNRDIKVVNLYYFINCNGEKTKAILSLGIGRFIELVKLAVEKRKRLVGTNVVLLPDDELKCRVRYRLTEFKYGVGEKDNGFCLYW